MQKEQFIHINEYGTKRYFADREMTILHREDGPAVEGYDGGKWWFLNGKLHNEKGPAFEYANGDKSWWFNGKLHNKKGPAIEWTNGNKSWFLNGEKLTEEEFNARMNPVTELTLDERFKHNS